MIRIMYKYYLEFLFVSGDFDSSGNLVKGALTRVKKITVAISPNKFDSSSYSFYNKNKVRNQSIFI